MKKLSILSLILFLGVTGTICYYLIIKETKAYYITVRPGIGTIEEKIHIPGNVYPIKEVEIKSHISGVLEDINVNIGDHLEPDDRIASISLVSSPADIERMESNFNVTSIEYEQLEADYNRNLNLFETGTISKTEFELVKKSYLVGREQYLTARNQLELMKTGISSSKEISNIVTSTTRGTVIDIPVEVGASVIERNNYNMGTTLIVLADLDHFIFRAQIAEHYLKNIHVGSEFRLKFTAYDSLETIASVIRISSKGIETGNGAVKYAVDALFDMNVSMPPIRSGYSATAEITLAKKENVLTVEEKNIRFSNDSVYVYLIDTIDGRPVKHLINTGLSDGKLTEITGGLTLDDEIVTNNIE